MKRASVFQKRFGVAILCLAGVSSILQLISYLTCYEGPKANFFSYGAVLPTFAFCLCIASLLLSIFLAIFSEKRKSVSLPAASEKSFLLLSLGFFASAILVCFEDGGLTFGKFSFPSWLLPLLLILSCFAFGLAGLPVSEKNRGYTALFLIFPVFALFLFVIHFYFDASLEITSPLKNSTIFALLCAMLYTVGEIRFLLRIPSPRVYLMTTLWTVSSSLFASFPVLLAYLAGKSDRIDLLASSVLCIAIALTSIIRTIAFLFFQEKNEATGAKL